MKEVKIYNWREINRKCAERDRLEKEKKSSEANRAIVERRNTEGVKIRVRNLLAK